MLYNINFKRITKIILHVKSPLVRKLKRHEECSHSSVSVMTGLRRVDSLAARCLLSRGRNKRAMVSRQKQEYQRQSRDVNNTRQGSRSQAQVQSSKVRQSRVKHRDGRKNNAQNVSQGENKTSHWVSVCVLLLCEWENEVQVWWGNQSDEWMVTAVWMGTRFITEPPT